MPTTTANGHRVFTCPASTDAAGCPPSPTLARAAQLGVFAGTRPSYVSASSVEAALRAGQLSNLPHPPGRYPAQTYLTPLGPGGYYGPDGPWGPSGEAGPVGDRPWNPTGWMPQRWMRAASDALLGASPRGPLGPLGAAGPVGRAALAAMKGSALGRHFLPGGVFANLGPFSGKGPRGLLGLPGPNGAGFERDAAGNFVTHLSRVIRTDVAPPGNRTTFDLHELYRSEDVVKQLGFANDTQWDLDGTLTRVDDVDHYQFTAKEDEPVFVQVRPTRARVSFAHALGEIALAPFRGFRPTVDPRQTFDDFDVRLYLVEKDTRRLIGDSTTTDQVDWIQTWVPKGAKLEVAVSLKSTWHQGDKPYRLSVAGGTSAAVDSCLRGPWQRAWEATA